MDVEFRLLGEVEVLVDGVPLPIRGIRQRGILATLLVQPRPVGLDALLDRVWGAGALPAKPANAVQTQMTLLRRELSAVENVAILWHNAGYTMTTGDHAVDLCRFRELVEQARAATDDIAAITLFDNALRWWRGEPFTGLDQPWFAGLRTTLVEERRAAELDLTDAQLRCGNHDALVPGLVSRTAEHPLDERLSGQLLLALYRGGRPADAAAEFQRLSQDLAEELGAEPGPAITRLYQQIQAADPTLEVAPATTTPTTTRRSNRRPLRHGIPPRNPFFTGRDVLLQDIHDHLDEPSSTGCRIAPLHGMGGVGKTQLAIEYCHRYGQDYSLVCWVDVHNTTRAMATLTALAADLGLSVDGPSTTVVARLWRALGERTGWLLVYDNVDEPSVVADLQPPDSGRLLMTGRSPALSRLSTLTVHVPAFRRAESIQLLTQRCPSLNALQAERVASAVEDLPLAVEQAGCYLNDTGLDVSDYLALLAARPADAGFADPTVERHPGLVAVVRTARDRLDVVCPPAARLLDQMSLLAPEPLRLLPDNSTESDGAAVRFGDVTTTADVLRHLDALGLVRRSGTTVQLHRLMHGLLRARIAEAEKCCQAAMTLLATARPGDANEPRAWPVFAALTPHVQAVVRHATTEPDAFRRLVRDILRYLFACGHYATQRELAEQTHERWVRTLGPDHVDSLDCANSLGLAQFELGDYPAARRTHEDTLERNRRTQGPDHRDSLRSASNLGVVLFGLGEYAASRDLTRDLLPRRRQVHGPDHLDTLRTAMNLACSLHELGDLGEAREIYEDTLHRSRRALGEDHPHTLRTANNLTGALNELGAYRAAAKLGQDTLSRRRRVLGEDNPQTLTSASTLTEVLTALGDYQVAHYLGRDTLERFRRVLGADHPLALITATTLLTSLTELHELKPARELGTDTLDRLRATLGPDHPRTLQAADALVVVLSRLGDLDAALPLAEDTVARCDRTCGPDHPQTHRATRNLEALRLSGST